MPVDVVALARALVLALFPSIAAAIRAGRLPRAACDDAWAERGALWRAEHGPEVALEAAAILDALGPIDVLIKSGTAAWIGRGPIAALPPPPEAIEPPRTVFVGPWGSFCRGPTRGPG